MNKKKLLILCLVFAALMIGAGALYSNLSADVQIGGLVTTPPETQVPTLAPAEQPAVETTQAPTEPEVSQPTETTELDYSAPDFTMLDKDGNEVNLSSFFGKPIILNFWASWCGPCKSEMPDLQEYYEKYGQEIHFLLVSLDDSVDTAKSFITEAGYTFPVYFDTTSMGAYTYGASSIPITFFIDANGDLVAYYRGAMSAGILQQGIEMIYTPAEAE